ncbi:hypothetical protein Pcinc_014025 [Petrolisthes cinctipes]|uniref:Uncharacterized protein n=1 Tax=Petrolisthes cinctipes TaxID=88211 RepID=A0AAE1KR26_PETCI|nr:hypothetical protein Pcinc_014025 [Petrolisthes cinctipes]
MDRKESDVMESWLREVVLGSPFALIMLSAECGLAGYDPTRIEEGESTWLQDLSTGESLMEEGGEVGRDEDGTEEWREQHRMVKKKGGRRENKTVRRNKIDVKRDRGGKEGETKGKVWNG